MQFNIETTKKNDEYIASCPELELFCFGKTEEEAKLRLKKTFLFYINTATELGYEINAKEFSHSVEENIHLNIKPIIH